jgi:POT family proton-dependent oligopeptide transporter
MMLPCPPASSSTLAASRRSVWTAAILGGLVADRLLGQYRSVLAGGVIIAAGHLVLAFDVLSAFYLGLTLIVIGTGLLKPNVSTLVGSLYAPGDARRDAGFSLFYMGINLGAFLGPIIAGYLAQRVNWHIGFAAAGVGMTPRPRPVHRRSRAPANRGEATVDEAGRGNRHRSILERAHS